MKALYIEWIDPVTVDKGGWAKRKRLKKAEPALCRSVGFLFEETDEVLKIHAHEVDGAIAGDVTIPKSLIRKRRVIAWKE